MSLISKPVEWEVYNIPSRSPIQYYSLLKQKRELSLLVKDYNSQVSRQSCLHFCDIEPKDISSSSSNECEIIIIFINDAPTTSFIGLKIKTNRENFIYESNSLLLFLKKTNKAASYLMNNSYIYVHCKSNAWQLFYLLYYDYLKKSVITILGTMFFCSFAYSICITKEIQLLSALYKGSKVIKVAKCSVYYKMNNKRKISVANLINMTMNMPKSNRYIISSFNPKAYLLYSDLYDGDFYTSAGSKINMSKLMLKKMKRQSNFHIIRSKNFNVEQSKHQVNNLSKQLFPIIKNFKRKFEEIEHEEQEIKLGPSTSKIIKTLELSYIDEASNCEWEQYRNIKPYAVKCYSNFPCINQLVPKLLKNGEILESNNIGLPSIKTNVYSDPVSQKRFFSDSQSFYKCSESQTGKYTSFVDNIDKLTTFGQRINENSQSNSICIKDGFTTASGKTINISDAAVFAADKFIQNISDENKEALQERNSNKITKKIPHRINYLHSKKKLFTKHIPLAKITRNNSTCGIEILDRNNDPSRNLEHFSSNIGGNYKVFNDMFSTLEDVNFSTAGGKQIQVSNTSMQAAHTLIRNVFNEENNSKSDREITLEKSCLKKTNVEYKDTGCCSQVTIDKELDIDMDDALVEKFFKDTFFDEKELGQISEYHKNHGTNSNLVPNNKNLISHKPRKSLGGRRSIRHCSMKLK